MRRVRRAKMPQAAHISDALDGMLKQLGLNEKMQQVRAMVIWDEVVGPQISAHTRPIRIRNDILEVNVDQPAWMQQLQLMKPQILRQLNPLLGERPLKDIFLKRGKVAHRASPHHAQVLPWSTIKLDDQERQGVTETLKGVEDSELRRELENYLTKQTRLLKSRTD